MATLSHITANSETPLKEKAYRKSETNPQVLSFGFQRGAGDI